MTVRPLGARGAEIAGGGVEDVEGLPSGNLLHNLT